MSSLKKDSGQQYPGQKQSSDGTNTAQDLENPSQHLCPHTQHPPPGLPE